MTPSVSNRHAKCYTNRDSLESVPRTPNNMNGSFLAYGLEEFRRLYWRASRGLPSLGVGFHMGPTPDFLLFGAA